MLARELKELAPALPVIFGGPGVGLPEVRRLVLAFGLVGRARPWARARPSRWPSPLTSRRRLAGSVAGVAVPGMSYRAAGSCRWPTAPPVLRGLPLPGLALLDYARNAGALPQLQSSRGWACLLARVPEPLAYCSETAYWKTHRLLTRRQVIAEIRRRPGGRGDGRRYVLLRRQRHQRQPSGWTSSWAGWPRTRTRPSCAAT